MHDRDQWAAQQTAFLEGYRALFVEEWRRKRISNVDMARSLGKSVSLVNKLKAGRVPLTSRLVDQFVAVLGIDPTRALFAVGILGNYLYYFDPQFIQSFPKAILLCQEFVEQYASLHPAECEKAAA